MKVKSESEVAQSCPTLSDPMDCSPPGSSIHGIFQAGVLEWGAIAFSEMLEQRVSITQEVRGGRKQVSATRRWSLDGRKRSQDLKLQKLPGGNYPARSHISSLWLKKKKAVAELGFL